MTKKQLGAAVTYLLAIALPTAAMAARYGFETKVDLTNSPAAVGQVLSIGGGIIAGVLISLLGSRWLVSETENLLQFALRVLRDASNSQAVRTR